MTRSGTYTMSILRTAQQGGYQFFSHCCLFQWLKVKAQRGQGSCPESHSLEGAELGLEPGLSGYKAHLPSTSSLTSFILILIYRDPEEEA